MSDICGLFGWDFFFGANYRNFTSEYKKRSAVGIDNDIAATCKSINSCASQRLFRPPGAETLAVKVGFSSHEI